MSADPLYYVEAAFAGSFNWVSHLPIGQMFLFYAVLPFICVGLVAVVAEGFKKNQRMYLARQRAKLQAKRPRLHVIASNGPTNLLRRKPANRPPGDDGPNVA